MIAAVEPNPGHKERCRDTDMTSLTLSAAAGGALALVLTIGDSVAVPLGLGSEAALQSVTTLTAIEDVHGTHRS